MKIRYFPEYISKKYLRLASVYRRFADRKSTFDFSIEALDNCYRNETYGDKLNPNNGYAYGKWLKDITVATWIEDILKGDACKAEFIFNVNYWWAEPTLKNVIVPSKGLFGYEGYQYDRTRNV